MKAKIFTFLRLLLEAFVLLFAYAFANTAIILMMPNGVVAITLTVLAVSLATIGIYLVFERFLEKRPWREIFMYSKLSSVVKGFAVGALFMSTVVGVMALLGCYGIEGCDFDWHDMYSFLIMFLYVGIGEEILFRGVVFWRVYELSNIYVALVGQLV